MTEENKPHSLTVIQTNIIDQDPDIDLGETDQLHRYQTLDAGQYWKAKQDGKQFSSGEVLLVQAIDWVDNKPHTLHIALHPLRVTEFSKTFKILTKDFLNAFDFEPDAEAIRQKEIEAIQTNITEMQKDLIETQADPVKFAGVIAKELNEPLRLTNNAPTTVSDGMGLMMRGGSLEELKMNAGHQIKVAEATAKWISTRVGAISSAVNSMIPFFEEKAMVALARTGDVQKQVKKILKGIESLDLYVGTKVVVHSIMEGESAPEDQKLLLMQRKLYMSRELSVHVDIDLNFDHKSKEFFMDYLVKNPGFRDQIFPSERCVVLMGVTDEIVRYSEDPYVNGQLNIENVRSFLLVRDGENIHAVYSPIESHFAVNRLFPLKSETDDVFKGYDGRNITFEDLDYTRKLGEHEQMALHYKRFLILLCGLDHRLGLFGKFYPGPQSFDFISQEFQDKYFHFANEDNAYIISGKPRLPRSGQYIAQQNKYLQSGSRVFCFWSYLISEDTAPSYYKSGYGNKEFEQSVAIAYERDGEVYVDCPLKGGKHKSVKVRLNERYMDSQETHSYIVLDRVNHEIIHRYIHEREHQFDHLNFMRLFRRVDAYLAQERDSEAAARAYLKESALDARLVDESKVDEAVNEAIANWRACNRGKELPALVNKRFAVSHDALMEHLFFSAGKGETMVNAIRENLESKGELVIRISMTGQCNLTAYVAPNEEDMKEIPYHPWVKKYSVVSGKNGVAISNENFVLMKRTIQEVPLYTCKDVKRYFDVKNPGLTRDQYLFGLSRINNFKSAMRTLANPDPSMVDALASKYLRLRSKITKKYISEPYISIPFAIIKNADGIIVYLSVTAPAHSILINLGAKVSPDKAREIGKSYYGIYQFKDKRVTEVRALIEAPITGVGQESLLVSETPINDIDEEMDGLVLTPHAFTYNYGGREIVGPFHRVNYGIEDNLDCRLDNARNAKGVQVLNVADYQGADRLAGVTIDYPEFPVKVQTCTISPRDGEMDHVWFGIFPFDTKHNYFFSDTFKDFMKPLRSESYGMSSSSEHKANLRDLYHNKSVAVEEILNVYPDIRFIEHNGMLYCSPTDPALADNPKLQYMNLSHNVIKIKP